MKVVISALHYPWSDMEACLRHATAGLGLDGVELSWHSSFARPHCTREDIEQLVRLSPGSGIELCAHIWENLARMEPSSAEDALRGWLELCGRTGVTGLVIHGGSYDDQREGIARTRRVLERVLPQFERQGVTLLLENHYAYDYRNCHELFSEPWEFQEVLSLESPALRICFDTGHAHMTRNIDELLTSLSDHLQHIHLADNDGRDDLHCAYAAGTVPFDRIYDTLATLGFDGTFCIESPVRDDLRSFRKCLSMIRERWPGAAGRGR
ncbi:MAG TPA: sugar phosphate isomerase/epimerase family protein [Armatimonadota bacterium]|nr:sugar phosphate isomerase/epimerase family protein [Armatimonadota bacterium]